MLNLQQLKGGRAIQDDWKRTQVRIPQEQYQSIMTYAEQNNLSLNSAMLVLMDKALKLPEDIFEDKIIEKIADKLFDKLNQNMQLTEKI